MLLSAFRSERVVVWGAGREGRAAVDVLRRYDPAELTLVDESPDATGPEGVRLVVGPQALAALHDAHIVVKSPGISRHRPEVAALEAAGTVVTGSMALWLEAMAGRTVVAVTGTKGKSTTAALLHRILEVAGRPSLLAGNIGVPVLSLLGTPASDAPDTVHVVEVSSYQAADVATTPALGILTSLYPEHLDWHGSLDAYVADKLNLFAHGSPGTTTVLVGPNIGPAADRLATLPADVTIPHWPLVGDEGLVLGPDHVLQAADVGLVGRHNLENAALALAAAEALGVEVRDDPDLVRRALGGFVGLAHRLSTVGTTTRDLTFVDDTLSTVPESTLAALDAFGDRPVTVIVGGHDRGVDVAGLAAGLARRQGWTGVACVPDTGIAIARALQAFEAAVGAGGSMVEVVEVESLDDAVAWAVARTPTDGVVLLSPAAPSYNRYRSHEELSARFADLLARYQG